MKVTADMIDAARTPNGGWTQAQLAAWGVSWPPVKGWKQRLIDGPPRPPAFQYLLQAQASGRLGPDELHALAEHAPRFVRMLCEGLNVTRAGLQKMATTGQLTIDLIGKGMA
jgi:tape measure domain-containing protein